MSAIKASSVVVLAAALSAMFASTPALAAPEVPKSEVFEVEFPAGEFCAFPLRLTILDGQKSHDSQGSVVLTGPLTVTVTNLSTGASKTLNASGPTLLDPRTGLNVGSGPWIIGQPASAGLNETFLIYNRGRAVFSQDGTLASTIGKTVDICAALT
jgi:hypothetical protein